MAGLTLTAPAFPHMVAPGDDLAGLIADALAGEGLVLEPDDVLVLAQKIVSKAEGRLVRLADVTPSPRATELAEVTAKDARLVELVLSEASEVVRARRGVIIVRHRLGMVLANAGIDQSNVTQEGDGTALLLPADPDASCAALRDRLASLTGVAPAVMIVDSVGRAWRNGTIGTAIGIAGAPGLANLRGRPDLFHRPLMTTEVGFADEVAAAASLLMGQAAEGRPLVLVRGLSLSRRDGSAAELIRPLQQDMFR
ncbi:coenzyme F420-0:L-glutamate ligase [Niveispirillum sp. KHB5.9]|uniref:coenzyme F420-0:L-glutamate ligase n=1 Tax=Niveispirillum sp. KHB5.9 TaxID=3400269 RepID=UPI003A88AB9F